MLLSLYLQRAWLVVCHIYQSLVGSASRDTSSGHSTFTAKPLNVDEDDATWLADMFFINHAENCSGDIVLASNTDDLLSKLRATGSATCHCLPESQQIHIRDLHWRIDGVGMMLLGHSFMTALCAVLSMGLGAQLDSCMAAMVANGVVSSGLTQCLDVESDAFLDVAATQELPLLLMMPLLLSAFGREEKSALTREEKSALTREEKSALTREEKSALTRGKSQLVMMMMPLLLIAIGQDSGHDRSGWEGEKLDAPATDDDNAAAACHRKHSSTMHST
ncbi:hypothetical protein QQS21_011071 [Conoideocrella luteorostrata]|uniref:Uncharacterized protein n=1 Tax=Conoideocrella luteorostrata TaxID=1105319 RepID=A0AAJ0CDT1_9HYPO|nr:hypothetical protein QQS21_011071 [Conoideocrella luteorostrata]